MTETYTGPTSPEDIDGDVDLTSARLDREADTILLDDESGIVGARPLHEAVREDAVAAREWGRTRVRRLRNAVEDEPLRASLYALGIGVVIGMLAAR